MDIFAGRHAAFTAEEVGKMVDIVKTAELCDFTDAMIVGEKLFGIFDAQGRKIPLGRKTVYFMKQSAKRAVAQTAQFSQVVDLQFLICIIYLHVTNGRCDPLFLSPRDAVDISPTEALCQQVIEQTHTVQLIVRTFLLAIPQGNDLRKLIGEIAAIVEDKGQHFIVVLEIDDIAFDIAIIQLKSVMLSAAEKINIPLYKMLTFSVDIQVFTASENQHKAAGLA